YVERLPFENDPPGNAGLALDVVPLEVVELAVVRNPSRVLPHLPPLDGYEEDRLRVEDLEGTVQDRFENRFLRPAAVDQAGNFLKGGKEQIALREVGRCRTHDLVMAIHGAEDRCNLHAAAGRSY